jgi:long-subunit fatty acid transport protein
MWRDRSIRKYRPSSRALTGPLLFVLACGVGMAPQRAWSEPASPGEFTALPLPVGSGARALGQGGAFTAIADDATAAVWNPAGLSQLERPEISIVGTYLATEQRFGDTEFVEGNGIAASYDFAGDGRESRSDLNFLSVTYPMVVSGRNLVVSLNYHQRYDFHQRVKFSTATTIDAFPPGEGQQDFDFHAEGGIGVLSPAVAVEVTPRLSLGVAVNLLRNEFFGGDAYTQDLRFTHESRLDLGLPPPIGTNSGAYTKHTAIDFSGTSATLGAMWRTWQHGASALVLAAVVETQFTADEDRTIRAKTYDRLQDGIPQPDTSEETKSHLKIDFPLSATVGAALRLSDSTTLAVDLGWTQWSEWVQEDQGTGERTRPIGGAPADTDVDDLFTARLGVEHVLAQAAGKVPLRAGVFYDPRPSLGNEQSIYGFSLGSGFATPRFSVDAAYQYRTGDDLSGRNLNGNLSATSFEVEEHLFIASLIAYF